MNKHSFHRLCLVLALTFSAWLVAAGAGAEELRDTGRRLAKELGAAIVNVQIVLSQQSSFGGNNSENEVKMETSGTVINPDGLTIVPLSAVDPSQVLKRMMSGDMGNQMSLNSRVKDIKLIVNKRKEIPATVVLRDEDLNIAFLRPIKKPAEPFKAIDIKTTAEPRLLDEVMVLARMGRVADREISVMTGEIQCLITKPRKFFVPSSELASGGLGVPIFDKNARFIGIVLMRTSPGGMEDSAGSMLGMGGQGGVLVVILPAKNIQDEAAQAPKEASEKLLNPSATPGPAATPLARKRPAAPLRK